MGNSALMGNSNEQFRANGQPHTLTGNSNEQFRANGQPHTLTGNSNGQFRALTNNSARCRIGQYEIQTIHRHESPRNHETRLSDIEVTKQLHQAHHFA